MSRKKTKSQIRGSKGAKYYQSNKANRYLSYWCSMVVVNNGGTNTKILV